MGKILLNDEEYGDSIVANPTETATDELTKISINGVVYSLPQGGGGGSAFEKVIISQALVDRPTERVIIEQQQ